MAATSVKRIRVVTRQGLEAVLVTVDIERHRLEIVGQVLNLGAVDQFLALQNTTEQQADDHQNNGDFDEREARLLTFHGSHFFLRYISALLTKLFSTGGPATCRCSESQWRRRN